MTKDEVIRMAMEVGLMPGSVGCDPSYIPMLERFASLVAAAEREAIAQEFDRRDNGIGFYDPNEPAEIIRARSNT